MIGKFGVLDSDYYGVTPYYISYKYIIFEGMSVYNKYRILTEICESEKIKFDQGNRIYDEVSIDVDYGYVFTISIFKMKNKIVDNTETFSSALKNSITLFNNYWVDKSIYTLSNYPINYDDYGAKGENFSYDYFSVLFNGVKYFGSSFINMLSDMALKETNSKSILDDAFVEAILYVNHSKEFKEIGEYKIPRYSEYIDIAEKIIIRLFNSHKISKENHDKWLSIIKHDWNDYILNPLMY